MTYDGAGALRVTPPSAAGPVAGGAAARRWSAATRCFSRVFSERAVRRSSNQPHASRNGRTTRSAPIWNGSTTLAAVPCAECSGPESASRKYAVVEHERDEDERDDDGTPSERPAGAGPNVEAAVR